MPDVKICNLDLIAPVQKRELILNGKTYEVEPLSVAKFIEFNQIRQKVGSGDSLEEGLKLMKEMIKAGIPSMTDQVMDAMSLAHLQLVVAFINDEIPDDVLNGKASEKNDKNEEEQEEGDKAENESGN